jgi:hypothetical protein
LNISGSSTAIIYGTASLVIAGVEAIIGLSTGTWQHIGFHYIIIQSYGAARYEH